jgi:hypothetical protein
MWTCIQCTDIQRVRGASAHTDVHLGVQFGKLRLFALSELRLLALADKLIVTLGDGVVRVLDRPARTRAPRRVVLAVAAPRVRVLAAVRAVAEEVVRVEAVCACVNSARPPGVTRAHAPDVGKSTLPTGSFPSAFELGRTGIAIMSSESEGAPGAYPPPFASSVSR